MKRIFTSFLLFLALATQAQRPGTPDKSFGSGGLAKTDIPGDSAGTIQQLPDGKIMASDRNFTFRRFYANGLPDSTYGMGGVAAVSFPDVIVGNDRIPILSRFIVLPDGKLLAAGWTGVYGIYDASLALARLLPNGTLDSSFGTNGTVLHNFANGLSPYATAIDRQASGNIIIAGSQRANIGLGLYTPFAISFLPDGTINTAFGTNGEAVAPYNGENYDMVLQSDGKIVLGGYRNYSADDYSVNMYRLTANGAIDATFNNSDTVSLNHDSYIYTLTAQPDDKILAGVTSGPYRQFTIACFTPGGIKDSTFGNAGFATISIALASIVRDILLPPNTGKIIAVGTMTALNNSDYGVAVAGFNANGSIDSTFGLDSGSTSRTKERPYWAASTLQSDGKILILTVRHIAGTRGGKDITEVVRLNGYDDTTLLARSTVAVLPTVNTPARVTVFPNPATHYLIVTGLPMTGKTTLTVTNAAGTLLGLYNVAATAGKYRIDVSQWKPGVYFLGINASGMRQTIHWMKP